MSLDLSKGERDICLVLTNAVWCHAHWTHNVPPWPRGSSVQLKGKERNKGD